MPPPQKKNHISQPSNGWGEWPPFDDFSIKDEPKVGKQPDPRSWLKARHLMNWTDWGGMWIEPYVKLKGPKGGCPQKSNPVHFCHNHQHIVAQDFFLKQGLVCYSTSFCVDVLLFTKGKAGKGLETMARLKGKMAVKKPSKAPLVFCSLPSKAGGLWRKVPLPKQKESQFFFWLFERLETCKDPLF